MTDIMTMVVMTIMSPMMMVMSSMMVMMVVVMMMPGPSPGLGNRRGRFSRYGRGGRRFVNTFLDGGLGFPPCRGLDRGSHDRPTILGGADCIDSFDRFMLGRQHLTM